MGTLANDQVVVYLIADNSNMMFLTYLKQPSQLILSPDTAHRVVGATQDKDFYIIVNNLLFKVLEIYCIDPVCVNQFTVNEPAVNILNCMMEGIVYGHIDDGRVTWLCKHMHAPEDTCDNPGRKTDPVAPDLPSMLFFFPLNEGLVIAVRCKEYP